MPSNDPAKDEEKDTDIISFILNGSPFKLRSDDEKIDILKKGRPLYNLNILKREISRSCSNTFHTSWYSIHKWLCGSRNYNKFFCWPCLLMRPETSSWCSIGNANMKRFTSLATKHARCKSHLKAIYEYDETLTSFGLPAEFISELKFECKEEGSLSDKTEVNDDLDNFYFLNTERKVSRTESNCNYEVKPNESTNNVPQLNEAHNIPNRSNNITFKAWQEMYKNSFPVPKARFFEDYHLFKWKRKIAKQELKNARLTGEKLKFEIEVLKAKVEYFNSLKEYGGKKNELSELTAIPVANESLNQRS